jgi:DNA polymerase-1
VHDELIVECNKDDAEKVAAILETEMQNAADLSVKLTADAGFGKNWLESKK